MWKESDLWSVILVVVHFNYIERFAKNGEIDEETRSDMAVKGALRKDFEVKRYPQKAMKDALSLKLLWKQ